VRFASICLLAAAASGADLSGIWTGQIIGRFDEVQDLAFRFVQNGPVLTGKMYGEIESQPVNEGKIEGDQITFMIGTEMNGGRSRFLYTGTIKDDDLHLTRQRILPPDAPDTDENRKRRVPQQIVLKRLISESSR
jgi:hypothetical protein